MAKDNRAVARTWCESPLSLGSRIDCRPFVRKEIKGFLIVEHLDLNGLQLVGDVLDAGQ